MPETITNSIKRELPQEWNGIIPSRVFLDEAKHIVAEGENHGIVLRAMGGVGIRLHTMEYQETAQRLDRLGETSRQEFTDLDFMAYRKQRPKLNQVFDALGYGWRRPTLSTAASERRIYFHPKGWFFVDVFFDELRVANHPIKFINRVELDSPTISVTDLLLEKLQIVYMGRKDVVDTLILLLAHTVGESDDPEIINAAYIAKLLAGDWGFWYTVMTNLKGIQDFISTDNQLTDDECAAIDTRVISLQRVIEAQPKTIKWALRSKIGTKQRWYEPVETMATVGDFGIWRLRDPPKKTD